MSKKPKKTLRAPKPQATITIRGAKYVIVLKSAYDKLVPRGEPGGGGGNKGDG